MAITAGSLVEFAVGGHLSGQLWMNAWTFRVVGELLTPTASEWGQAYWNHVKVNYRALVASVHSAAFEFVKVRELDDAAGEYGEFAIPTSERAGTGTTGAGGILPIFAAASTRLTVATRVTRPGQKRISGQDEVDANGNSWEVAYQTKLNTFYTGVTGHITLGAPAAGSELQMVVVRKDPNTGLPVAHQDVTGFLVNPYISSQVTRKVGRGA